MILHQSFLQRENHPAREDKYEIRKHVQYIDWLRSHFLPSSWSVDSHIPPHRFKINALVQGIMLETPFSHACTNPMHLTSMRDGERVLTSGEGQRIGTQPMFMEKMSVNQLSMGLDHTKSDMSLSVQKYNTL